MMSQVMQRRFSRWLVRKKILDMVTASKALVNVTANRLMLGELATQQKMLTAQQVDEILSLSLKSSERFGDTAKRLGYLNEDQVLSLLALQQEDPLALGNSLKQMNLLDSKRVDCLLLEYLAEELRLLPTTEASCVQVSV